MPAGEVTAVGELDPAQQWFPLPKETAKSVKKEVSALPDW